MTLFAYKAVDPRGRRMSGALDAASVGDLDTRLRRRGLDLVDGRPARRAVFARRRVGRVELIHFCFHLEQLLGAGLPLLESLADLRDGITHPQLREVVAGLIESIHGGANLSQAMAAHPQVFGEVFRSLVKAGEDTGRLPEILKNLTVTLTWEDELATQTRRLALYPALAGVVVAGATLFLLIVLVPQLAGFFRGMGQSVPLATRVLIFLSTVVTEYGVALLAALTATVVGAVVFVRANAAMRARLDALLIALPGIGPVVERIILARVAGVLALMYASGITILDAVRGTEAVAGNRVIADGLRRVAREIDAGRSLTAAFEGTGLFPPLVIRMLRIGEQTGALDAALANVSQFYHRDVREAIARIQVLIEPVLTALLGLVLGAVMLAVLGPIYDIIAKLKV